MLRVAAVRAGERVATWIICASSARSQKCNTATPDAGTEPGAVVLIDTYHQSVFPLRQILAQDLWKPRCPVPKVSADFEIATQVTNHTIHRAAIFRSLADMVLDITRDAADSPDPLPSEKEFAHAIE